MSAAIERLAAGAPKPLFDGNNFRLDAFHPSFDLLPDGRFLVNRPYHSAVNAGPPRIVWVDNWLSDLKARHFQ